jgi:hypothetical protein
MGLGTTVDEVATASSACDVDLEIRVGGSSQREEPALTSGHARILRGRRRMHVCSGRVGLWSHPRLPAGFAPEGTCKYEGDADWE